MTPKVKKLENLFLFLLRASFFIPALFVFRRYLINKEINWLETLVLVHCFSFALLNIFFSQIIQLIGNNIYYHIYTALEFVSFSTIIYQSSTTLLSKTILLSSICIFFVYIITIQTYYHGQRGDSLNIGVETIFILTNVIYFFYLRFKQVDEHYLYQDPFFWFMTGMLVYLGYTFFFNLLVNHVDNEVIKNYYHYSYIGDIIKNLLFTVGLFYLPSKKESTSRSNFFNAPNLDLI